MKIPPDLAKVVEELRCIEDSLEEGDRATHFVETRFSEGDAELQINGNPQGLVHVARAILDVVLAGIDGAHHHFDQFGVVDPCELPVVVRLKPAEWDKQ